jgi:hypothetical protein
VTDRSEIYKDGDLTLTHVSESGNEYFLSRNSTAAKRAGTLWSCNCMSWVIQKKRPCKHLKNERRISLPYEDGTDLIYKPNQPRPSTGSKEIESAKKVAVRTGRERERNSRLSTLRYGFQLAETYHESDFKAGMTAEIKYDGIMGMLVDGKIINRSGNDVTNRFPEIQSTDQAVLLGEIVIFGKDGLSDFHAMQERQTDDPNKIRFRSQLQPATFMAFDILERYDAQADETIDLTDFLARERRGVLEHFMAENALKGVQLSQQLNVRDHEEVMRLVGICREAGTEGLMLKDPNAPYRAKRGKAWLKAKTWQEEEFDIVKYGETGVGKGFTIFVQSGSHLQEVTCNGIEMRRQIELGHAHRVEVKFLSKSAEGAMRFPTLRRIVK